MGEMGKLVSKTQFLKKLWSDEGKGYARSQKEGKYSGEGGREQVRRRAKLCPQTEFQGCETCRAREDQKHHMLSSCSATDSLKG